MDENMRDDVIVEEAVMDEGGGEPMTLDDALAQARAEIEARDEEGREEAIAEDVVAEEAPDTVPEETAPVESATTTPPVETGTTEADAMREQLAQQSQMLAQYQQQMQAMQQQMQMMAQQEQIQQNNNEAAQTVAEAMLTPPTLDFSSIMYASDEEQKTAIDNFVNGTEAFVRNKIMKDLAPVIDEFKAREVQAQRSNVKEGYRHNDGYTGFAEREPWIEQIIEKNGLGGLPLNKQYEIAYLITRGVDAMKAEKNPAPAPAPKTIDERLSEIEGDPELMKALEAKRVKGIAQSQKDTPPGFVAGGGANRVGLNIPNEPMDFDMARNDAMSFIRGRR